MSWTAILTVLSLSLTSAYLVFIQSWAIWQAFLLVGGGALGLILSVIAIVYVLADADGRKSFSNGFKQSFQEDFGGLLRWIRGK